MSELPPKLGKYEIIRTLGEGAMGVVYEAIDRVIDRRVAIKTIRSSDLDTEEAAEQRRRFLVEARAAGKLNHPHIVSLYDYGDEAGTAYLVMELVEGRELQRYFDEGISFPLGDILRLSGELLDALAYSHRHGVVHRDVKPANIFITQTGSLKLGDFGIARIDSTQKTRAGLVLGTPSHMAPEQIRGETADARSDLYAAGVVLFQLLTGVRPFSGNMLAMAMKVLNEPAPKPSSIKPQLAPELDAVVTRALAKKAEQRFQDAAEFWQALAAAAGLAVTPPHPLPQVGQPAGAPAEASETTPFGNSIFPSSGFGSRSYATGSGSWPTASSTASQPAPQSANSGWPVGLTVAALGLAGLLAIAAGFWLWVGQPSPSQADGRALAPASQTNDSPKQPAPIVSESPAQPPAQPPAQSLPESPAPIEIPPHQLVVEPPRQAEPARPAAAVSAPAAMPTTAGSSVAKPAPAPPKTKDEAPRSTPAVPGPPERRQAKAEAARSAPALPEVSVMPPSPPAAKAARPGRCSDILMKASLEPLTADESSFLKRECQ